MFYLKIIFVVLKSLEFPYKFSDLFVNFCKLSAEIFLGCIAHFNNFRSEQVWETAVFLGREQVNTATLRKDTHFDSVSPPLCIHSKEADE